MPTYGKIASLPTVMRNAVNRMLDENVNEGQIATKITAMLAKSSIPEIAEITVSQQNVSSWRTGGYHKWTAEAKARQMAERIAVVKGDGNKVQDSGVADNIADCILGELAVQATRLTEGKASESERRKIIDWMVPHVTALRRGSHARSWIRLEALKLELAINRLAQTCDPRPAEPPQSGGLTDEALQEIEMAAGFDDDTGYEYQTFTKEEVQKIRRDTDEMIKRM